MTMPSGGQGESTGAEKLLASFIELLQARNESGPESARTLEAEIQLEEAARVFPPGSEGWKQALEDLSSHLQGEGALTDASIALAFAQAIEAVVKSGRRSNEVTEAFEPLRSAYLASDVRELILRVLPDLIEELAHRSEAAGQVASGFRRDAERDYIEAIRAAGGAWMLDAPPTDPEQEGGEPADEGQDPLTAAMERVLGSDLFDSLPKRRWECERCGSPAVTGHRCCWRHSTNEELEDAMRLAGEGRCPSMTVRGRPCGARSTWTSAPFCDNHSLGFRPRLNDEIVTPPDTVVPGTAMALRYVAPRPAHSCQEQRKLCYYPALVGQAKCWAHSTPEERQAALEIVGPGACIVRTARNKPCGSKASGTMPVCGNHRFVLAASP